MFTLHLNEISLLTYNYLIGQLKQNSLFNKSMLVIHTTGEHLEEYTNLNINLLHLDLSKTIKDDYTTEVIESTNLKIPLVVSVPTDKESCADFLKTSTSFGLSFVDTKTALLQEIPKLDKSLDYVIIDEIFNDTHNLSSMYNPIDFCTHFNITDKEVTNLQTGENVLLEEFNFTNLYSQVNIEAIKKIKKHQTFLSNYIISPIPLMLETDIDALLYKLDNYKRQVFQKAIDLDINRLLELPTPVIEVYMRAGYLPFTKLVEITGGN